MIVGEEIMTSSGEIIGLYLNEEIPAGLSCDETIDRIIGQGGVVYVPHPYDEKRATLVWTENQALAHVASVGQLPRNWTPPRKSRHRAPSQEASACMLTLFTS